MPRSTLPAKRCRQSWNGAWVHSQPGIIYWCAPTCPAQHPSRSGKKENFAGKSFQDPQPAEQDLLTRVQHMPAWRLSPRDKSLTNWRVRDQSVEKQLCPCSNPLESSLGPHLPHIAKLGVGVLFCWQWYHRRFEWNYFTNISTVMNFSLVEQILGFLSIGWDFSLSL